MFVPVDGHVFFDALILLFMAFEQPAVERLHLPGHLFGHKELFRASDHLGRRVPEYLRLFTPVDVASGVHTLDSDGNGDVVQHLGKKAVQVLRFDSGNEFIVDSPQLNQICCVCR